MDSGSDAKLKCYYIDATNWSAECLSRVFALSQEIFIKGTSENHDKPSRQLSVWESRIQTPGSRIIYVTEASKNDRPLGFMFIVSRTAPEIGQELPHIWLAGVDPASRGLGVFPVLMNRVKDYAREENQQALTVCTFPARFEKMFRILRQHGWDEVARRENGAKVLLKTSI